MASDNHGTHDGARADPKLMDPPSHFLCPITGKVMAEPALMPNGDIYERAAIEYWLNLGHGVDPITFEPTVVTVAFPDKVLVLS